MSNRRLFLKQLGLGALTTGVLLQFPEISIATPTLTAGLPRSTPEQQGISSAGILAFVDAFGSNPKIEPHSFMILRHGVVVSEGWWAPYQAPYKHTLYSLSKSFTSTAVGLAITEGKLKLTDKVISFFPDRVPDSISENLNAMTVQHLLMMGTGHDKDTLEALRTGDQTSWEKTFLSIPVDWEPGTHFVYNTGSTYMQSAIIQKVTGMTVKDYLTPRLFEPLGIDRMDWETNAEGVDVGGYGLRVKTEDIAKLGQLYLQKGKWNGKQIIPESWVADATTSHIDNSPAVPKIPREVNDWSQGYCYQFWRCTHNGFRGDGAFGQFCIVLPDKDTVVVMTSESFDLQASMNLVWDHLYPAIGDKPIPNDKVADKNWSSKLGQLKLNPPAGALSSPWTKKVSGKVFTMEPNDFAIQSLSLQVNNKDCVLEVTDKEGKHRVVCGMGKWILNEGFKTQDIFPIPRRPAVPTVLAGSAVWTSPDSLTMSWRFAETAHSDSIVFSFAGKKVNLKFQNSVSKANPDFPDKRPELTGAMA